MEIEVEDKRVENITKIINFIKSEAGSYLVKMVSETQQNRINELIYADKNDIFNCQGEVRAYNDILNLLKEDTLVIIRQQVADEGSNI